jgi:hypothetical protein
LLDAQLCAELARGKKNRMKQWGHGEDDEAQQEGELNTTNRKEGQLKKLKADGQCAVLNWRYNISNGMSASGGQTD